MNRSLITSFLMVILFSCASGQQGQQQGVFPKEGWIDDNTYRVQAMGSPGGSPGTQEWRRKSAKNEAKKSAQQKIAEQLMGTIREFYSSIDDFCEPSQFPAMVKGHINAGSVIDERYDDQDNCTILYEVKSPGFKKLVTPPIPCNWGK